MFEKRKIKKIIRQGIQEKKYGSFEEFKAAVEKLKNEIEDLPNPPPPPSAIIGKKAARRRRKPLPVTTVSTVIILALMLLVMIVAVPVIVIKINGLSAKAIASTKITDIESIEEYNTDYNDNIVYLAGQGFIIKDAWTRESGGEIIGVCEKFSLQSDGNLTVQGVMDARLNVDYSYRRYYNEFNKNATGESYWGDTVIKYNGDNTSVRIMFSIGGVIYHIDALTETGAGGITAQSIVQTLISLLNNPLNA